MTILLASTKRSQCRKGLHMREMLRKSGIQPEVLPPEEDTKKLQRRMKSEDKKLPKTVRKLKE